MNKLTRDKINKILDQRRHLSLEDEARFSAKIDYKGPDECWNWTSTIAHNGYGKFYLRGETNYAHRIAFIHSGKMKNRNNYVLHKCDNPQCVNPAHLFEGTQETNMHDMINKGRKGSPIMKLNPEAVKVIKWMLKYKPQKRLAIKLARLYHVTPATISQIKRGVKWSQVYV